MCDAYEVLKKYPFGSEKKMEYYGVGDLVFYKVKSVISALGALVFTDWIPFLQESFVS